MAARSSRSGAGAATGADALGADDPDGILTAGIASDVSVVELFEARFATRDVSAEGTIGGITLLSAAACAVGRGAGVRRSTAGVAASRCGRGGSSAALGPATVRVGSGWVSIRSVLPVVATELGSAARESDWVARVSITCSGRTNVVWTMVSDEEAGWLARFSAAPFAAPAVIPTGVGLAI